MARQRINPLEPIIGSITCIVIPTVARLFLMPSLGTALPFATYFPAILIATLLWGIGWGAVVLAASGLIAGLLFVQTSAIALLDPSGLAALGLFAAAGTLILYIAIMLRRALIELDTARNVEVARKAELQHRLKNTLTVVQSFATYLSRRSTDVDEFRRKLDAQIAALAKANEVLFATKFEGAVSLMRTRLRTMQLGL